MGPHFGEQRQQFLGLFDLPFTFNNNFNRHIVLLMSTHIRKILNYPGNSTPVIILSSKYLISSMPDTAISGSVWSSSGEILPLYSTLDRICLMQLSLAFFLLSERKIVH